MSLQLPWAESIPADEFRAVGEVMKRLIVEAATALVDMSCLKKDLKRKTRAVESSALSAAYTAAKVGEGRVAGSEHQG